MSNLDNHKNHRPLSEDGGDSDCSIVARIRSHSHVVPASIFAAFSGPEYCHIRMVRVDDARFDVFVNSGRLLEEGVLSDQAGSGSYVLAGFLMGLNIASLGLFDWDVKYVQTPCFALMNSKQVIGLFRSPEIPDAFDFYEPKAELTSSCLFRAAQIMGVVADESDDQIFSEYMKGIFHFGFRFYGLTFRKEAFANFYRSLEFFVTNRVLKKKKLSNERCDFEEAFKQIGIPDRVIDMFKSEIYIARSSQVMHAQNKQVEIDWELVAKVKMVCDATMHKVYEPLWNIAK